MMRDARDVRYSVGRDETLDLIIAEVKKPLKREIYELRSALRRVLYSHDTNGFIDAGAMLQARAAVLEKEKDAAPGA